MKLGQRRSKGTHLELVDESMAQDERVEEQLLQARPSFSSPVSSFNHIIVLHKTESLIKIINFKIVMTKNHHYIKINYFKTLTVLVLN